jgi:hypothetical protein
VEEVKTSAGRARYENYGKVRIAIKHGSGPVCNKIHYNQCSVNTLLLKYLPQFGNFYGATGSCSVDSLPKLISTTFGALSDVAPLAFWSPYYPWRETTAKTITQRNFENFGNIPESLAANLLLGDAHRKRGLTRSNLNSTINENLSNAHSTE